MEFSAGNGIGIATAWDFDFCEESVSKSNIFSGAFARTEIII